MPRPKEVPLLNVPPADLLCAQWIKHDDQYGKVARHIRAEGRLDHHGTPSHRRDEEMALDKAQTARARELNAHEATQADIADALVFSGTHRPLSPG